jgi:hypothetical protein
MNLRQIEELVAGHGYGDSPDSPKNESLRCRRVIYEDIQTETVALERQARQAANDGHGENLKDNEFLRTVYQYYLTGGRSQETSSRPAYKIAITTCRDCKRSWQHGSGRALEIAPETLERVSCDATLLGSVDKDNTARATATVTPRVRERIFARDQYRCVVPQCRNARNVEIHHIKPRSHGGGNEESNLCLLCGAHHKLHHDGLLQISGYAPDGLTFIPLPRVPVLQRQCDDDDDDDLDAHVGA